MAAFVGYIVQANGIAFPWAKVGGVDIPAGLSPPEQWDAMPVEAKWQIILFIGFLEWFSEAAGTHYMRGGTPGAFPKFSDNTGLVPHPLPLNLFDPFGFSKNKSAEQKEAGLIKELNNGRLAQIGILGFISEQRLEGSVPLLKGLVTHYSGETMAPVRNIIVKLFMSKVIFLLFVLSVSHYCTSFDSISLAIVTVLLLIFNTRDLILMNSAIWRRKPLLQHSAAERNTCRNICFLP
jgi:hypothetical protein